MISSTAAMKNKLKSGRSKKVTKRTTLKPSHGEFLVLAQELALPLFFRSINQTLITFVADLFRASRFCCTLRMTFHAYRNNIFEFHRCKKFLLASNLTSGLLPKAWPSFLQRHDSATLIASVVYSFLGSTLKIIANSSVSLITPSRVAVAPSSLCHVATAPEYAPRRT